MRSKRFTFAAFVAGSTAIASLALAGPAHAGGTGGLDWQVTGTSCAGAGSKTLKIEAHVTGATPGQSYALYGQPAGDKESDDVTATAADFNATFSVTGLHGPADVDLESADGVKATERIISMVCPAPVAVPGPGSAAPKAAPTPHLGWTILGTSCSSGLIVVKTKITGAIVSHSYGMYGTSGYRASSGTVKAKSSSFVTSFTLTSSWKSFQGDVESLDKPSQDSKVRSIGFVCKTVTPRVQPSSHATSQSPTPGTSRTITFDRNTTAATTSSAPVVAVPSASPVAAVHHSGGGLPGWMIALLVVALVVIALAAASMIHRQRARRL